MAYVEKSIYKDNIENKYIDLCCKVMEIISASLTQIFKKNTNIIELTTRYYCI